MPSKLINYHNRLNRAGLVAVYLTVWPDKAVPEVILKQSHVRALVGQGEAASMAQHVGMDAKGQGGEFLPVGFMRARSFNYATIARN